MLRSRSSFETSTGPFFKPGSNGANLNVSVDAELLKHYRRKVAALAANSDNFQRQLDQITEAINRQHALRKQLRESEETVQKLQNQLSKMRVLLHAERHRVLKLYAGNDRLKLCELEDCRRMEHLPWLTPLSPTEDDTTLRPLQNVVQWIATGTIFLREPLKAHSDKQLPKLTSNASYGALLDQLKRCQLLLQEVASEYLHLRIRHRFSEKTWTAEKECFLARTGLLDCLSFQLPVKNTETRREQDFFGDLDDGKLNGAHRREWELRKFIEKLEFQFDQQRLLAVQCRERVLEVEEKNCHILEECNKSRKIPTDKIRKLKEINQLCVWRYKALEQRKKLEVEGYRTDIGVLIGFAIGFGLRQLPRIDENLKVWISMPGDIYIRLLKLTILPLIASNVIIVIAKLDPKENGKISTVAFIYIVFFNILGASIGTAAAAAIGPDTSGSRPPKENEKAATTSDVFADLFLNIFPDNIVGIALYQI
ncbi:sodium:dicarboxylate symporter [Echinococcus multilocularis]|uniref:Amino acid transporter n=1 Tax=Echinococcus multilocularis TaxID=6211 RepID=A0A068YE25_ECHMU|nr:sodium:dicarboxylate symporter [Echinococcus multilocularis]